MPHPCDSSDGSVDGIYVESSPVHAVETTFSPTIVDGYRLPDPKTVNIVVGESTTVEFRYEPLAATSAIPVTFQAVDSVSGLAVPIAQLTIAPDNQSGGMGVAFFDGPPTESGSDPANGLGIVSLEPGDYELAIRSSDSSYFWALEFPYYHNLFSFSVSEGMGTVALPLEQGGFFDLTFIDDGTNDLFLYQSPANSGACGQLTIPDYGTTGYCDATYGAPVDGTASWTTPLPAGTIILTPGYIPGYQTPAPITLTVVPGERAVEEIRYFPYDETFVMVTVQTVDLATGDPIYLGTLKIAEDNDSPGMGALIFDDQPAEPGTDQANGIGVIALQPGDYEIEARSFDQFYFDSGPIAVTVAEDMGTVQLPQELGGYITLQIIDGETGLPPASLPSQLCVTLNVPDEFGTPHFNCSPPGETQVRPWRLMRPGEHIVTPYSITGYEAPQPVNATVIGGQATVTDLPIYPYHPPTTTPTQTSTSSLSVEPRDSATTASLSIPGIAFDLIRVDAGDDCENGVAETQPVTASATTGSDGLAHFGIVPHGIYCIDVLTTAVDGYTYAGGLLAVGLNPNEVLTATLYFDPTPTTTPTSSPTNTPSSTPTSTTTPTTTPTQTSVPSDAVIQVTTAGVTYDENGESATPLANLVVNLYAVNSVEECYGSVGSLSVYATLTTDANGEGTFSNLPRGEYCVGPATLESGTWGTSAGNLAEVFLTSTPTASVSLRYYPLPTVRLNMVDDQGQPLIGDGATTGCLSIERTDDFGATSTIPVCDADDASGADGTITFTGGEGVYSVTSYEPPAGYSLSTPLAALGFYLCAGCGDVARTLSHYPYNTGTGPGITVVSGDVTITFTEVTQPGATWATLQTGGFATDMPPGYAFEDATFYHVQSTAQFTGPITICVTYDPADYHHPEAIALFVPGGDPWFDATTTNTGAGQVCGVTDSLNSFFIGEPMVYGQISAVLLSTESGARFPDKSVSLFRLPDGNESLDDCWSNSQIFVAELMTDANGEVDFGMQPAGEYCVHGDSYPIDGYEFSGSISRFALVDEGSTTLVTFDYDFIPRGTVHATFVDTDGTPIEGQYFCLVLSRSTDFQNVCNDGVASFAERLVPAGEWQVVYPDALYEFVPAPGFPTSLTVVEDQTTMVELAYRALEDPTTTIVIEVLDPDGNPVPNVCVTPHGAHQYSCMNNGNGYAVLGGHYQPGQIVHLDVFVGGSASIRQSISFEIQPGETLVQRTVILQPSLVIQLESPRWIHRPANLPDPEPRRFRYWVLHL